MLTKQAQEEIFNSYYNQGVGLALGQVKVAKLSDRSIDNLLWLSKAIERGTTGNTLRSNTLADGVTSIQEKDIKKFPFLRSALLLGNAFT